MNYVNYNGEHTKETEGRESIDERQKNAGMHALILHSVDHGLQGGLGDIERHFGLRRIPRGGLCLEFCQAVCCEREFCSQRWPYLGNCQMMCCSIECIERSRESDGTKNKIWKKCKIVGLRSKPPVSLSSVIPSSHSGAKTTEP